MTFCIPGDVARSAGGRGFPHFSRFYVAVTSAQSEFVRIRRKKVAFCFMVHCTLKESISAENILNRRYQPFKTISSSSSSAFYRIGDDRATVCPSTPCLTLWRTDRDYDEIIHSRLKQLEEVISEESYGSKSKSFLLPPLYGFFRPRQWR